MSPTVLVFNAGSSSLKHAFFDGSAKRSHDSVRLSGDTTAERAARVFLESSLDITRRNGGKLSDVVAHRVVHGGDAFAGPVRVTPDVVAELERLTPLAPLHEPQSLAVIRVVSELLPDVPQVACFDTAFHRIMPRAEQAFGLPRRYFDAGVKRYGFHGLAYESVIERLRQIDQEAAAGRVLACHLGNGASLCAIRGGKSVATTMSFTPTDGLLMGTRAGNLDPGAVLYLERHDGLTPDQVDHLLTKESGLLGASGGISSDMRELLSSSDPAAAEAVELFCYRVVREAGAMAAALGGVDAIAFSGGIGENAAAVRERIVAQLRWLGPVRVYVVPADEEAVIARRAKELLAPGG